MFLRCVWKNAYGDGKCKLVAVLRIWSDEVTGAKAASSVTHPINLYFTIRYTSSVN